MLQDARSRPLSGAGDCTSDTGRFCHRLRRWLESHHQSLMRLGNQVVSGGQRVIAARTASSGASQGKIARDIASKLIPAIFEVTKITTPTGGVIVPIIRLSTKIRPNWIGSMP